MTNQLPVDILRLRDGGTVALSFFKNVVHQVEVAIPQLEIGKPYSPEALCLEASRNDPNAARRCLSEIVNDMVLPIVFSGLADDYFITDQEGYWNEASVCAEIAIFLTWR